MRATGFWSLAALVVGGLMLADWLTHPQGAQATITGATTVQRSLGNQLIGTKG